MTEKSKKILFFFMLLTLLAFWSFIPSDAYADVIIDNGDPETSYIGMWSVSGGTNPYGTNSLWSRDGPRYIWTFSPTVTGDYEVSMWWTEYYSRSSNVPVDIQHSGGTTRIYINQLQNGGQWNILGTFSFAAGSSYNVTIYSQPAPTSTCADAVRFLMGSAPVNNPPVANNDAFNVYENSNNNALNVLANDSDPDPGDTLAITAVGTPNHGGTVTINGTANGLFYTPALGFTGTETFTYTIEDEAEASDQATVTVTVSTEVQGIEHIYVLCAYPIPTGPTISMLQSLGAHQEGDIWRYTNVNQNKEYAIHIILEDKQAYLDALRTENAHIVMSGHANYGTGPLPVTASETTRGEIRDVYYADDPRFVLLSSPQWGVSIRGMQESQAYPNWQPILRDGTDARVPFDFGDPRGDPAYNYYITYQVPGDQTHYRIDTARYVALQRRPDSDATPWYSPDGATPNSSNPSHRQYFITLPTHFGFIGDWDDSSGFSDSYGGDCHYTFAGSGSNQAKWTFTLPSAGTYEIYAWYPYSADNTTSALYTVNRSGGSTTVQRNQRINNGQWNELGSFYFNADKYSVILSDNTPSGRVVADAIKIEHANNPPEPLTANFYARPLYGEAPLEVQFSNQSMGAVTSVLWNFGDGTPPSSESEHTYTNPGTYTVSLTVYGPSGSDTKTKVNYITVGGTASVCQAEFSMSGRGGAQQIDVPSEVEFRDRSGSTGTITSWLWDFGDGETSSLEDPSHTYRISGIYTVSLTVTDDNGNISKETKENFIRANIYRGFIDDDLPTQHYGSRTILFRRELDVPKEEMRFSRMMYHSCSTGIYFLDSLGQGLVFYSLQSSGGKVYLAYLQAYLEGKSDQEIWEICQDVPNGGHRWDYYDFRELPSAQTSWESPITMGVTEEPARPKVDYILDPEKEAKILELENISLE